MHPFDAADMYDYMERHYNDPELEEDEEWDDER